MRVFVVAPSFQRFRHEASVRLAGQALTVRPTLGRIEAGGTEYIYVSSPDQMRGCTGVRVEFWGPPPSGYSNQEWAAQIAVVTRP